MKVNDKRVKQKPKAFFEDLPIGQVYEDRDGVLCIKTHDAECEDNCICFVNEKWEVNLESLAAEVVPLATTLEIER
jgi:hypothetical protein